MPRNSWTGDHMPAFRDGASSTSCVLHPIRPSILSLLQTGLLLALVVTFVVWAVGPAPTNGKTPAWSIATGHEHGVRAAAFSPDGRRLAAGGEDGCIVLWEVGKGFEKELSHHPRCGVVGLIFSRDGTTLASAHGNAPHSRDTWMWPEASISPPTAPLWQPEVTMEAFDSGTWHREESRQPCAVIPPRSALSVSPRMGEPSLLAASGGW
jgi:WD40 repeat protein